MHKRARYLVLIEQDGAMIARLFDTDRQPVIEIDASSEEVAVMTSGLQPVHEAAQPAWNHALRGHNPQERERAQVYTLDV